MRDTVAAARSITAEILPALILFGALSYSLLVDPLLSREYQLAITGALTPTANLQGVGGNPLNQIVWFALFGLSAAVAWRNRSRLRPIPWHILFLGAFLAVAILSAAWSDVPSITFRRAVLQLFVTGSVIIPFLVHPRPRELLTIAALLLAVVTFASIAWHFLQGTYVERGATGIYAHKNKLGQIAAVSTLVLALQAFSTQRRWHKLFFAASAAGALYLCLISNSKTSQGLLLITPLIAASVIAIQAVRLPARRLVLASFALLASLALFAALIARFGVSDVSQILYDDPTFTGRTIIWQWMWKYIEDVPLLGHGYASFWSIGPESKPVREGYWYIQIINDGHNGYIDVLIETGALGLTLALLFCLALLMAVVSLRNQDRSTKVLLLAVLVFILLHNGMETSLLAAYRPLWLLLLLVAGAASRDMDAAPAALRSG